MATPNHIRVLRNQLSHELGAFAHDNMLLAADCDGDVCKWYFLICALPDPYLGGEYIMELRAGKRYPMDPPEVFLHTRTGVFMPGVDICVSVGKYHATDTASDGGSGWRPGLGMVGFAQQMLNGLICYADMGHGIGIERTTLAMKKDLATKSRASNATHAMGPMFEAIIASGDPAKEPFKTLQAARQAHR